jgi:hypothetical protein
VLHHIGDQLRDDHRYAVTGRLGNLPTRSWSPSSWRVMKCLVRQPHSVILHGVS